ncbi:14 kDa phosphohistidine phosphatase (Phosphohistidine phosphatase 1) (PHPT1) (Protein histidine phosphatase) (PHP) [Durusdinium trenchii]|uniref:14 kDa phosphohistidine phosphatase (Phosphohistidine phosphatase 1) (PHPT1) (Protein histidine phosphatase) (PHP) n=1 Tax=Durusdinium trenchii TaxID=1381693 RepID=A0ABP0K2Z1_9DINO
MPFKDAALQELADAIIDEGTFKYVLLRATAASGQQKYLVRGTSGAAYHRDVALPYVKSYMKDGFGIEVLGGGRILHDTQRPDHERGAGHEISAEVGHDSPLPYLPNDCDDIMLPSQSRIIWPGLPSVLFWLRGWRWYPAHLDESTLNMRVSWSDEGY